MTALRNVSDGKPLAGVLDTHRTSIARFAVSSLPNESRTLQARPTLAERRNDDDTGYPW